MWLVLAFGSALFAGISSVFSKYGIQRTPPDLTSFIRTLVMLLFSIFMAFLRHPAGTSLYIEPQTFFLIVLSGFLVGLSWICFFQALKTGSVSQVVPVDKLSTVFAVFLSFLFLGESVDGFKMAGILTILVGTFLVVRANRNLIGGQRGSPKALFYALLSALFSSPSAVLGKLACRGLEPNLANSVRLGAVLAITLVMIVCKRELRLIKRIPRPELPYLLIVGITTAFSTCCYYTALQSGPAGIIDPLDKLSAPFASLLSFLVLKESLSRGMVIGLLILSAGILTMIGSVL